MTGSRSFRSTGRAEPGLCFLSVLAMALQLQPGRQRGQGMHIGRHGDVRALQNRSVWAEASRSW